MARLKTDSDLAAIRADIATIAHSINRLKAEIGETRRLALKGNGHRRAGNGDGEHHIMEDLLSGAMTMGSGAAEAAGEAVHAGTAWVDDMLKKNATPAVLTALGVGFVLGVMGRR